MKLLGKIRDAIVLGLIRISKREFVRKEEVQYEGNRSKVFLYSKDDSWELGKTIGGMAVGLNESKLKEYPEVMRKYTFLHEKAHKDSFVGWKLFYYPVAYLSALALIVSMIGSIMVAISFLLPFEVGITLSDTVTVAGFYLPLFVMMKWIDEGYADIKAFGQLNLEEREEVVNHLKRESILDWLLMRINYPPISWTEYAAGKIYSAR
jgi:hypothetical protein